MNSNLWKQNCIIIINNVIDENTDEKIKILTQE